MDTKFKIGDIVVLKSGGPKMTINKLILKRNVVSNMRGFNDDFEGEYECKWFEGMEGKTDNFQENALQLAE